MKRRPPKPFSPDDLVQLTHAGTRVPPQASRRRWPSLRPTTVLIARGLMLYRFVDLATVPASRRTALVRAQARAWSPFAESGCRVLWFANGAGLFAWDAARLREILAQVPELRGGWISLVPESAYIAAPDGGEGVRLLRGIDGFEGQLWRGGHLVSSRSWGVCPDEDDWHNFQRGARATSEALRPIAEGLVEPTPWTADLIARVSSPDILMDRAALIERSAVFSGSLLLMLATAVTARQYWDIARRYEELKIELAQREQAATTNRASRDRALAASQQVGALTDALSRPNVLEIQDYLLSHLPQTGTEIQDLAIDGMQLRIVLKAPSSLAREAIVRELEQGGLLADVREARDSPSGTLSLVMSVRQPRGSAALAKAQ